MRLYNRELEQIQNAERENRIQEIAEKNISFLVEKYGIDEDFLMKRLEKLSVVERKGKTHFVIQNGEKFEINSNAPASFVTKKDMEFDGNKWSFENAVYTSDNNGNHTITHELFHFLAENTEMDFDTNGIGYDKRGVSIDGYDREDGKVDVGMKASGLNEGITEMLAMEVDGMDAPATYESQVYLAAILVNSQDNALINAYFSEDSRNFKKFLEDFDTRQSVTSSKKLVSLSTISDGVIDVELLKGCLEYSLSFCQNMEQLTNERKRLLPIFKSMSMSNGLNIEFSDENFDVKHFFSDMMSTKRQEIQERSKSVQELGKESLLELQETSYIDDTQQNIVLQEKMNENHKGTVQGL